MSALIGRNLGQYEVIGLLGKGGMATVYLGRQTSIDRNVAIKVLSQNPALDEQFKERFRLEAQIIGNLQHPHILPLYDYGTEGDILYLVMAYVEGGALEDLIELGPMDVREVEKILRALAGAVDYAHGRGVVHRDIKPANILMNGKHPLLSDFGMVKIMASGANLTGTGIVGTPAYMPPEQAQSKGVGAGVDIYALGATVYEMLTGQQPFTGDTPLQLILAHLNQPPPDVRLLRPDLPAEMTDVLYKAMAKTPEERYATASDFAEAFSHALHQNSDTLADIQRQFPLRDTIQTNTKMTPVTLAAERAALQSTEDLPPAVSPSQILRMPKQNRAPLLIGGIIGAVLLAVALGIIALMGGGGAADTVAEATVAQTPVSTPAVVASVPTFGQVRFSSDAALGDRVEVALEGVRPPSAGAGYAAWLINSSTGDALILGRMVVNSFGEGTITYTDPEGRLLAAVYNALVITAESEPGTAPGGDVLYHGFVVPAVSAALGEIFVISEENGLDNRGTRTSLLDGAQIEANFAIQHAGLAARATNPGGVLTHAEHTINILRGESEDYNGNGRGENPGRGVGVYFFLDQMDARLNDALSAEGISTTVQSNGEFMRICIQNARLWADEVAALEQEMILRAGADGATIEDVTAQAERSTVVAEQLLSGADANENGVIEPFEGECGMAQIAEYGLELVRMDVVEGALNAG